jgi:large subunit ribosomal protein L16
MKFLSKNKKFKKYFKIKQKLITRYPKLEFGIYGLQILKQANLKIEHLEVCLKILKKYLKPYSKLNVLRWRCFPDNIVTKKPKDIRMGRGKGLVVYKHSCLRAGSLLFELSHIPEKLAYFVIILCIQKLPVIAKFYKK